MAVAMVAVSHPCLRISAWFYGRGRAVSAARGPLPHLLEHPAVAVRVAEGGVGAVVGTVGVRAGHPFRLPALVGDPLGAVAVLEDPSGVVEHLAQLDASAAELRVGLLDVRD